MKPTELLNRLRAEMHRFCSCVPAAERETEQSLARLRAEMARFWFTTPADTLEAHYIGGIGGLHRKISTGSLKSTRLSAEEDELARKVVRGIQTGQGGQELARYLLVAMLYMNAHELPADLDPMKLPEWLRGDGFRFLVTPPDFLKYLGETEAYGEHLCRVIERLYQGLHSTDPTGSWQRMALIFAEKATFQQLYFTHRNLKPIATRRAQIVDYTTRLKRHDLDYTVPPRPKGRSRIRLGIYMWSLGRHTETYATLPLFMALDPGQFEVRLYVHQSDGNPMERRARRFAEHFTVLPETLKAGVAKIRADDLDILIFGNNLSAGAGYAFNMANYRLARAQGIHFCNPITSGKRHIDFFLLGDLIAQNLDLDRCFSEKVLTVAGSGICFDLPAPASEAVGGRSRTDLEIPESATVFISGANYFKIIPELRHLWAKILAQVPGSVLLLYPFGPAWSQHYPKRQLIDGICRIFGQHGIDSKRLVVMDRLKNREDILALHRMADIYLDAVPYNGATSLLDPLQEGVPPIVVDGKDLRFAQGAAILKELGLSELVTAGEEEYIRLAVWLAKDSLRRADLRRRLQERMRGTPPFQNPHLYAARVSEVFRSLFPAMASPPAQATVLANCPVAVTGCKTT